MMAILDLNISKALVIGDPNADLERMYIEEYLDSMGYCYHAMSFLPEVLRRQLMTEASRYASCQLAQIEQRARFVRDIHLDTA